MNAQRRHRGPLALGLDQVLLCAVRASVRQPRRARDAGSGGVKLISILARLSALVFSALLVTAPLTATPRLAGRIPSWEQSHLKEGDVATRALYFLAVCIRNQRLAQAETMLRTRPNSPEEIAATPLVRPPAYDHCLIRTTKLVIHQRNVLRGAIAEAIYNGRQVRPRSNAALPFDVTAVVPMGTTGGSNFGRAVAACVVQREPARAHDVVQFNPGSIAEFRALKALAPTFTACLPADASLQTSRLSMRADLAESLYQAWRARPDLFMVRR